MNEKISTPLEGIRVLDLGRYQAGPRCALMFARMGAEVIKIEPTHGEQLRHMAAPHNGVNPAFYSCNRGKDLSSGAQASKSSI